MKKATSVIKSSPKAGVETKGVEGDVHTKSEIIPKDSLAIEGSKIAEIEKRTTGQRHINLIWEITQAIIAGGVTSAVVYAELTGRSSEILGNAFTLIIAIYFVRMNHTKVGGIGGTDTR